MVLLLSPEIVAWASLDPALPPRELFPHSPSAPVLITAVYYDPLFTGDTSEAVQIQNTSGAPLTIAGWSLSDDDGQVFFPGGTTIAARQKLWATKSANAFRSEFGVGPAFEYGANSDPAVPDMTGTALSLSNEGDYVVLTDDHGNAVDGVAYGDGQLYSADWTGPGVSPFAVSGESGEGQILYRKMNEPDGLPVQDSNSAADWAQDKADSTSGKRILLPGWDLDEFFQPLRATEDAHIKYCVAPDNLFECYRDEIVAAQDSIQIEAYSLDNAAIADLLVQKIKAGVRVSLLLDADAWNDQGKWACQSIEAAGGQCWLMDAKPQARIAKRYANLHGKWTLFDGKRLFLSSENLGDDGMPADDKSDGTLGTRGAGLVTDSITIVLRAQQIMNRDLDPTNHLDVRRWGTDANDFPPLGFVPSYKTGGSAYPTKFVTPYSTQGIISFELVQCPENCLRQSDALLGLIGRAGEGDLLLVEQLYEYKFWGDPIGNPVLDPNVRLEAYLQAARRGAHVQVLLDSFYDDFSDGRSNYETCRYLNGFSAYYSIECRLGNPTGLGMHNKMVLLRHGGTAFVHLGSINGSETSVKSNRELALQVESADAYAYWSKVFMYDWSASSLSPRQILLPLIQRS